MEIERNIVDLYELQSVLKVGVSEIFPSRVWVRAEVAAVKTRSTGHCYIDLAQSEDGRLKAKAQAVVWSSRMRELGPRFESVAGAPLSEGMSILALVQVSYSQLYGMSLVIEDLDPSFSLGEAERKRRETVARLREEGVLRMQDSLEMAPLPRRFAVISAETAAGYRDFMRHLHENPDGFSFHTELFPSLMQGADAPADICAALGAIAEREEDFDAVLILRGGGSSLDLACFDDYGLCASIAQFPLPVLTAVGHDQDHHICDMVAWTYLKTPTALADEIISWYQDEDERLLSFGTRLRMAFSSRLAGMSAAVDVLEARIRAADPRNILSRGYALALDGAGVVMKSAAGRKTGDRVSIMFSDGTLSCIVDKVDESEERTE